MPLFEMKTSLRPRITFAVAVIALGLAVLTSLLSYVLTYRNAVDQSRATLVQLAEAVQRTASIAVYLDNREIAQDAILGVSKNNLVAAVSIRSLTGFDVAYGRFSKPVEDAGHVRYALMSPFTENQRMGEIIIQPRYSAIENQARKEALRNALMLAAFTIVLALAISRLVQRLFVSPLLGVAGALSAATPGETVAVEVPRQHEQDEIGQLASHVSQLLGLVKQKLDTERALREDLQNLERRFRMMFERASVGIFLLDAKGRLLMANPSFRRMVGESRYKMLSGEKLDPPAECFLHTDAAARLLRQAASQTVPVSGDFVLSADESSEERWVHCLFTRVLDESGETLLGETVFQGIMDDITERKRSELAVQHEAAHDPLTGLLNRRAMEHRLGAALDMARAEKQCVAVCLIDLDGFKQINDTYGHEAGDRVLVEVAARLKSCLRQYDHCARLGGDEFLIAAIGLGCATAIKVVAEKILKQFETDIEIMGGIEVKVGMSMGIVLSDEQEGDMDELVSLADRAMYRVKTSGKNGYAIYAPE